MNSNRSLVEAPKDRIRNIRTIFRCKSCDSSTDAPGFTKRAAKQLCRECFGKGQDRRPRVLNDLTGAEWARFSKSVESYPDTRSDKQKLHGACFPKSLASHQIKIFTKQGDTVLDPFVGVGTTIDAASELDRAGVGIELNPKFVKLAKQSLNGKLKNKVRQKIILGDAQNLEKYVQKESVDFILTSPPYATLLKSVRGNFAYKWREHSTLNPIKNPKPYSTQKKDLGNMSYVEFLGAIEHIMVGLLSVLKPESYAVWVVKDYRDLKNGLPYINFHGDVITAAIKAGFILWDIRIYDQTRFRPLVCLGFPSRNFYLNLGHSYLLTFKKTGKR